MISPKIREMNRNAGFEIVRLNCTGMERVDEWIVYLVGRNEV